MFWCHCGLHATDESKQFETSFAIVVCDAVLVIRNMPRVFQIFNVESIGKLLFLLGHQTLLFFGTFFRKYVT